MQTDTQTQTLLFGNRAVIVAQPIAPPVRLEPAPPQFVYSHAELLEIERDARALYEQMHGASNERGRRLCIGVCAPSRNTLTR